MASQYGTHQDTYAQSVITIHCEALAPTVLSDLRRSQFAPGQEHGVIPTAPGAVDDPMRRVLEGDLLFMHQAEEGGIITANAPVVFSLWDNEPFTRGAVFVGGATVNQAPANSLRSNLIAAAVSGTHTTANTGPEYISSQDRVMAFPPDVTRESPNMTSGNVDPETGAVLKRRYTSQTFSARYITKTMRKKWNIHELFTQIDTSAGGVGVAGAITSSVINDFLMIDHVRSDVRTFLPRMDLARLLALSAWGCENLLTHAGVLLTVLTDANTPNIAAFAERDNADTVAARFQNKLSRYAAPYFNAHEICAEAAVTNEAAEPAVRRRRRTTYIQGILDRINRAHDAFIGHYTVGIALTSAEPGVNFNLLIARHT